MQDLISRYEFGNVPRSLFTLDGSLFFALDKSKIVRHLESLTKKLPMTSMVETNTSILLIDGVALLHKIQKGKVIITCKDLSEVFINMIIHACTGFDEVHLLMDRYLDKSLKNQTRSKRATTARKFVIGANTNIQNVSMKDLLSHSTTKRDLIDFLCDKALEKSRNSNSLNKFCVTYNTETYGNFDFHESLTSHSHEEADTLLILHASRLLKSCLLFVDSPDTDVLVLLIHHSPYLPPCTLFRTGNTCYF